MDARRYARARWICAPDTDVQFAARVGPVCARVPYARVVVAVVCARGCARRARARARGYARDDVSLTMRDDRFAAINQ